MFSHEPHDLFDAIPVVRVTNVRPVRVICLSNHPVGLYTHWDDSERVRRACVGDSCAYCNSAHGLRRWYGYLWVAREDGSGCALCELTANASKYFTAARIKFGTLSGCRITLERRGPRKWGTVSAKIEAPEIGWDPASTHQLPDLPKWILRLYRVSEVPSALKMVSLNAVG